MTTGMRPWKARLQSCPQFVISNYGFVPIPDHSRDEGVTASYQSVYVGRCRLQNNPCRIQAKSRGTIFWDPSRPRGADATTNIVHNSPTSFGVSIVDKPEKVRVEEGTTGVGNQLRKNISRDGTLNGLGPRHLNKGRALFSRRRRDK